MKRSEVVELILKTTLDQLLYSNTFTKTDADLVLKKLEQAGMLPPTTTLSKLGTIDNAWDEE